MYLKSDVLNSEELMRSIYDKAQDELVNLGVKKIFKELGFTVLDYNSNPTLKADTNNFIKLEEVLDEEGREELKIVKSKINRKINYHLKHNLFKTLEDTLVKDIGIEVQKWIIEQARLQAEMQIRTKLYKNYTNIIEEHLYNQIINDPVIKEIMLRKI